MIKVVIPVYVDTWECNTDADCPPATPQLMILEPGDKMVKKVKWVQVRRAPKNTRFSYYFPYTHLSTSSIATCSLSCRDLCTYCLDLMIQISVAQLMAKYPLCV